MRRWILFAAAVVVGLALDLGTKEAAFDLLPNVHATRPITSWFALTHAVNKGAAFGLFQGQHTFFMVVSIVAFAAVPYFVHTADARARAVPIVLGLILSGVLGNFWDRVVHGHVRDFLDIHTPPEGALYDLFKGVFGQTVWPTFNVADIFITCGALLMIVLTGREPAEGKAAEGVGRPEVRQGPGGGEAPPAPPPSEGTPEVRQEPAVEAAARPSPDIATPA